MKIDETKLIHREYKIADLIESFIMESPDPDKTLEIIIQASRAAFYRRGMRDLMKDPRP